MVMLPLGMLVMLQPEMLVVMPLHGVEMVVPPHGVVPQLGQKTVLNPHMEMLRVGVVISLHGAHHLTNKVEMLLHGAVMLTIIPVTMQHGLPINLEMNLHGVQIITQTETPLRGEVNTAT